MALLTSASILAAGIPPVSPRVLLHLTATVDAFSSSLAGTVPSHACVTNNDPITRQDQASRSKKYQNQKDGRVRAGISRSLRSPASKATLLLKPITHCLNTTHGVETDRPCPRHVPNTNDQVRILKSEEEWGREKGEGQESFLCRTKTGLPAVCNDMSATRTRLPTYLGKTYVQTVWCHNTLGDLYIEQEAIKTSNSRFMEKISGLEP